ncbi:hypothetical protein EV401DRAFT_1966131 [Pisolithus croceorrhizus]|nr:hypothetical protein EV401DRAFT_1966131 [Pisolithus croceorrhizus]
MSLETEVSLSVIQFTLLFYDYTLTFSREIELFWKRPRRSWPFVLFIANRYLIILSHVPSSIYMFWSPGVDSSYSVRVVLWTLYDGISIIVVQTIGAIIMTMRIYALYERNRCVLTILVLLAVGAIAVGLVSPPCFGLCFYYLLSLLAVAVPTQEPQIGCPGNGALSSVDTDLSAAWGGQLLFDVVVFGLTLWRSVYARTPGKRNVSDVLLRDVMSAATIGNIITLLDSVKSVASSFTNRDRQGLHFLRCRIRMRLP